MDSKLLLIINMKSHKPFQMSRKSQALDDLKRKLRTLLCRPCGIVAKQYTSQTVGGVTVRYGDNEFL